MHRTTKLKVTDINQHLICILCDGYLIDATTIVECLHSFCRTCIVQYLENSRYCPVCDVQVHKTKPLQSIRSDTTLQDIVYKLIPGLYPNEMQRRREFYSEHPEAAAKCSSEERGEGAEQRCFYSPKENISLTLEYFSGSDGQEESQSEDSETKSDKDYLTRHLRCPAAMPIANLKKFIRMKFSVPNSYTIKILYSDTLLSDDYTLMDIAYIFSWRRAGPMKFLYTFLHDSSTKRLLNVPQEAAAREKVPEPTLSAHPDPEPVAETNDLDTSTSVVVAEAPPPTEVLNSNAQCDETMETETPEPPRPPSPVEEPKVVAAAAVPEPMEVTEPVPPKPASPKEEVVPPLPQPPPMMIPQTAVVASANGLKLKLIHCADTKKSSKSAGRKGGRSRYKSAPVQTRFPRLAPYPPPQLKIAPLVSPNLVTALVSNTATTLCTKNSPIMAMPTMSATFPVVTCSVASQQQMVSGRVPTSTAPSGAYMRGIVPRAIMPSPMVNGQQRDSKPGTPQPLPAAFVAVSNPSPVVPTATSVAQNVVTNVCPPSGAVNVSTAPIVSSSNHVVTTVSHSVSNAITTVSHPVPTISLNNVVTSSVNHQVSNVSSVATVGPPTVMLNGSVSAVASSASRSCPLSMPIYSSVNSSTVTTSVSRPTGVVPSPSVSTVATSAVSHPTVVPSPVSTNSSGTPSAVFGRPPSVVPNSSSSTASPSAVFGLAVTQPFMPNGCVSNSNPPSSEGSVVQTAPRTPTPQASEAKPADPPVVSSSPQKEATKSPEKNGIGGEEPAKLTRQELVQQVKNSISAEFSDTEDLVGQPDLVVDEQKMDSSEEEDSDAALQETIAAIAAKEDDVDSGRASDISSQARSSCDDDVGSPASDPAPLLPVAPPTSSSSSDRSVKSNNIHHVISNLHKHHSDQQRKDPFGALDLSSSSSGKKPGEGGPRPKAVANPVLDIKHRQQNYLPAPNKPHTACVPAPKPPTGSPILLNALHHQNTPNKSPHLPVPSFPHFSPSQSRAVSRPVVHQSPLIPTSCIPNFMLGQAQFPLRASPSNHLKGVAAPQNPYSKLSLATHFNKQSPTPRKPDKSLSNNSRTMNYTPGAQASYPKSPLASHKLSPHHRSASPAPSSSPLIPPSATPSSSSPSVSSPSPKSSSQSIIPMYKKSSSSNSYRGYAPYKFKGSNFSVINPDPSGNLQKLVIRNNDVRPSNHQKS